MASFSNKILSFFSLWLFLSATSGQDVKIELLGLRDSTEPGYEVILDILNDTLRWEGFDYNHDPDITWFVYGETITELPGRLEGKTWFSPIEFDGWNKIQARTEVWALFDQTSPPASDIGPPYIEYIYPLGLGHNLTSVKVDYFLYGNVSLNVSTSKYTTVFSNECNVSSCDLNFISSEVPLDYEYANRIMRSIRLDFEVTPGGFILIDKVEVFDASAPKDEGSHSSSTESSWTVPTEQGSTTEGGDNSLGINFLILYLGLAAYTLLRC